MFKRSANGVAASAKVARPRPTELPLQLAQQKHYMRASTLPQSPLSEVIVVGQSMVSPSSGFAVSASQVSPLQLQRQLDSLLSMMVYNAPKEMGYRSLGQAGDEANRVSTFADLYRAHARDDADLNKVKSPTSRDAGAGWAALHGHPEAVRVSQSKTRKAQLRRSRSLGDMQPLVVASPVAETRSSMEHADAPIPTEEPSTPTHPLHNVAEPVHPVSGQLKSVAENMVRSEAKTMAAFSKRFKNRPPQLNLAPPSRVLPPLPVKPVTRNTVTDPAPSLPSPPPPSALMKVKSPAPPVVAPRRLPRPPVLVPSRSLPPPVVTMSRVPSLKAPYWVKKVPKTPRTMRTERRQGWGGSWEMAGISHVVGELKMV
ncbi:hypothetical protein BDW22DRAFT_606307 [Trametopsis cervina]|nr:hypothetical protein BDW22DRAFT_606307 [Trametopsis cervina]